MESSAKLHRTLCFTEDSRLESVPHVYIILAYFPLLQSRSRSECPCSCFCEGIRAFSVDIPMYDVARMSVEAVIIIGQGNPHQHGLFDMSADTCGQGRIQRGGGISAGIIRDFTNIRPDIRTHV